MKNPPPDPTVPEASLTNTSLACLLDELKRMAEAILDLPGVRQVKDRVVEVDLSKLSQLVMRRGELSSQLSSFDTADLSEQERVAFKKKLSVCEALDKEVLQCFEQGKQALDRQLQECHANRRVMEQYKLRLSDQNVTQDEDA